MKRRDPQPWVAGGHGLLLGLGPMTRTIAGRAARRASRDGETTRRAAMLDALPAPVALFDDRGRAVGVAEDITEQKQTDSRIKRLIRLYAAQSQINSLILRVCNREELFSEACRIAVEAGALRMAWIGVLARGTQDGNVVAWCSGETGYVDQVRLTARANTPDSDHPASLALRLQQPVLCNDIATDASAAMHRDKLLRQGIKAAAYLPLTLSGRTEAVLALFAGESGAFDDTQLRLLLELTGNIAFALDNIERQERLDYLAYYDALTGLANRNLFLERVAQYIRGASTGGHKLALYLLDVARFKNLNDSLGQAAGDALLRQAAQWLTGTVQDANLLARVGPDLFAVVVPQVVQEGEVARLVEKSVQGFVEHAFWLNGAEYRIGAKAGVVLYPEDGASADILLNHAEEALEKAKRSSARYLFYTQKMTAAMAGKLVLENQLRQALERQEYVLHYQPKVSLQTGSLTGVEALLRWNDPRTGLVLPGEFIPVLEQTGLIEEVGRWVLQQAIADYLRWREAGLRAVRIAVNVSPVQLRAPGFVAEIARALAVDAGAAAGLELELTETVIMDDARHSITSLRAIRALGVRTAIDDFGTGFSSLSYLAQLPLDTLKIDHSFVAGMTATPEGLALVSSIISLAHSLKLKVVAEGVESEEQSRLLRLLNGDECQGYLYGKAMPCGEFETTWLQRPAQHEELQ